MEVPIGLLKKYNIPIPRYTSYPTVPYWDETIDKWKWKDRLKLRFDECNNLDGISLYIHLPFCEKLCTFCGCNKKITKNHAVEDEYMEALLTEWKAYLNIMGKKPLLKELHIGGGTPTFFSPENLDKILSTIIGDSDVPKDHEFGFEGHPNNTTYDHLKTLFDLGFQRVSYGMQDSNIDIQTVINRIQPQENVERVVNQAREIGYDSVNLDLVYGLPLQTLSKMEKTILDALELRPDRVAFYSYAHVPWTSRAQRLFDESDLPDFSTKMKLYQLGKNMFREAGYEEVGMDHFALPSDMMVKTKNKGELHRNFMGYTVQQTGMQLGIGVSSISDVYYGYAQNEKNIRGYYKQVNNGELPVFRGYFLNEDDQSMRKYILDISCNGHTEFRSKDMAMIENYSIPVLKELEKDDLVVLNNKGVQVTKLGDHFIRNICKAFDLKLLTAETEKTSFSKAI